MDTAKLIHGNIAESSELDDYGIATVKIYGGPHDLHIAIVRTYKHNCGAYEENWICSCGAYWQNAMNGCWQQQHQREETGDAMLPVRIDYD